MSRLFGLLLWLCVEHAVLGTAWLAEPFDYRNGNLNESAMFPIPLGFNKCGFRNVFVCV
jgi:hypothetical protein